MRSLAILSALLLLTACASFRSQTSSDFDRGNTPIDQFTRESAACEADGEKRRSMDGLGGLAGIAQMYGSFNRVYDACMRSKGYTRKPA